MWDVECGFAMRGWRCGIGHGGCYNDCVFSVNSGMGEGKGGLCFSGKAVAASDPAVEADQLCALHTRALQAARSSASCYKSIKPLQNLVGKRRRGRVAKP